MKSIALNINGPSGQLETVIEASDIDVIDQLKKEIVGTRIKSLAFVCHPHPLHGGTFNNKVVTTLCRAFHQADILTVRFNFRGVGLSEGIYDEGNGEQADLKAVIQFICKQYNLQHLPIILAGFSFGAYVASKVALELVSNNQNLSHLILVGTPVSRWPVPYVFDKTLVIHGSDDEVINIEDVVKWAKLYNLPVHVINEASHFFHGKLLILKDQILNYLQ